MQTSSPYLAIRWSHAGPTCTASNKTWFRRGEEQQCIWLGSKANWYPNPKISSKFKKQTHPSTKIVLVEVKETEKAIKQWAIQWRWPHPTIFRPQKSRLWLTKTKSNSATKVLSTMSQGKIQAWTKMICRQVISSTNTLFQQKQSSGYRNQEGQVAEAAISIHQQARFQLPKFKNYQTSRILRN